MKYNRIGRVNMDSNRRFFVREEWQIEKLIIPDINEVDRTVIVKMMEISEGLEEINQVFQLFIYSIDKFASEYELVYNDKLYRKSDKTTSWLEVNYYITNIISYGKTLCGAIESFVKNNMGEEKKELFKNKYLTKKYDEVFEYRFLLSMRDYTQHGHVLVSLDIDRYCFDLDQIMRTPHFNPKPSVFNSMKDIQHEIEERYHSEPHFALIVTLKKYTVALLEVFNDFLQFISDYYMLYCNEYINILKKYSPIINNQPEQLRNLLVYDVSDGNADILDVTENPMNGYNNMRNEVIMKLNEYK